MFPQCRTASNIGAEVVFSIITHMCKGSPLLALDNEVARILSVVVHRSAQRSITRHKRIGASLYLNRRGQVGIEVYSRCVGKAIRTEHHIVLDIGLQYSINANGHPIGLYTAHGEAPHAAARPRYRHAHGGHVAHKVGHVGRHFHLKLFCRLLNHTHSTRSAIGFHHHFFDVVRTCGVVNNGLCADSCGHEARKQEW